MTSSQSPPPGEIVLAGGGHAHALVIRKLGKHPIPGTRVTLVSPAPLAPYSGMLPGVIAGHYPLDALNINLEQLCRRANIRFVVSAVTGLDMENRRLSLSGMADIPFDVLSLNTGSTPKQDIAGVAAHAISVKPIPQFLQRWRALFEQLKGGGPPQTIAMVGGGAGAVETLLAMAWACRHDGAVEAVPQLHLVFQGSDILPEYPESVRRAALAACDELGIVLHANFRVEQVSAKGLSGGKQTFLGADHVFWCTEAAAPAWPAIAGLDCNESGFIRVTDTLQSASHPAVFAVGDIAHMIENPRPKAGVYAVRQAPVLCKNLHGIVQGQSLGTYQAQDKFLSLLALGGKKATGCRGSFSLSGAWVWRWKDHIDRQFVHSLSR